MNTKGLGALILASFYYIFFRLIWPRISWIFEKEPPIPANWTSVTAAEHFFLRHFDSKKFPGSGNMVTCLRLKIKEDVTWSEFMSRMKLAARAVQMECPTLQVGAAARHRHTRRVKWFWVRQPEIPEIPILVEDQLSWMDVVRRETNTNYPLIGPFMRLILVKEPEAAGSNPNNFVRDLNVVWSIHHSVCDYLSAMNTMFKLFSYLDKPPKQMHPDMEKDKVIQTIPAPKQALKPYTQYLLPRKILYFMQSAFDIKLRNNMPSLPLVKKLPAVRLSLFEQLDFTEKQTANFIAQCKAHSLSPTFVLNALCMIAYHRGVLGSPAKSEKFVTNITIDLRRALPKCSLTESDLCHFSSGAYANTTINKDMDVWTLARKSYNNFISNVKMGVHVTHFMSQDLFSLFNFEDTESPFPYMFGNLKVIKPYYGESLDLMPTGTTAFSIKGISNHVTCYWLATESDNRMHASFTWNNAMDEKCVRNYLQEIKNNFIDIGNGVDVRSMMHGDEKPVLEVPQQPAAVHA